MSAMKSNTAINGKRARDEVDGTAGSGVSAEVPEMPAAELDDSDDEIGMLQCPRPIFCRVLADLQGRCLLLKGIARSSSRKGGRRNEQVSMLCYQERTTSTHGIKK